MVANAALTKRRRMNKLRVKRFRNYWLSLVGRLAKQYLGMERRRTGGIRTAFCPVTSSGFLLCFWVVLPHLCHLLSCKLPEVRHWLVLYPHHLSHCYMNICCMEKEKLSGKIVCGKGNGRIKLKDSCSFDGSEWIIYLNNSSIQANKII